jgi:hypothetical protein
MSKKQKNKKIVKAGFIAFKTEPELKDCFERACKEMDIYPAQVFRNFMRGWISLSERQRILLNSFGIFEFLQTVRWPESINENREEK